MDGEPGSAIHAARNRCAIGYTLLAACSAELDGWGLLASGRETILGASCRTFREKGNRKRQIGRARMQAGNAANAFRACLVLILVSLFGRTSIAQAAFIPVIPDNPGIADPVRTSLEYSLLRERLAIMGLSAEEATARLEKMSPAEREVLLAEMGGIQAGGEGDSAFIQALLVFLQVIIIVYFFSFAWLG